MARKIKDPRRKAKAQPQRSQATDLADAIIKKYTAFADHLLKSDTDNPADESDPESTENAS